MTMQITPGWLYSMKDGTMIVEFGAHTSYEKDGIFEVNRNRRVTTVNRKPWTVYNNFIWCPTVERDDLKAVQLFIEHEDREIDILKDRLKKHESKRTDLELVERAYRIGIITERRK